MSTINKVWLEESLTEYAKRARFLRQRLFLEPYPKHNRQACQDYLREMDEYDFIVDLFNHFACGEWSKEDFKAEL